MTNEVQPIELKGEELDELLRRLRGMKLVGEQIMTTPDDWCPPALDRRGVPLTTAQRKEQKELLEEMLNKRQQLQKDKKSQGA